MEVLLNAIKQLSNCHELADIQTYVKIAARKIACADGATFILKEGDQCHYADEDAIAPLWKGCRFPATANIAGWAMRHQQSVVVEDVNDDARIQDGMYDATFVTSLAIVPIHSLDPIGAIGVYWSASHRPSEEVLKKLEALANMASVAMENAELYGKLNLRVLKRTALLLAAQKKAEAANATKSRFLAMASHDLRQPLQQLSAMTSIVLRSKQLEDVQQQFGKIQHVIGDIKMLLDTLLDLDKLERGEVKPSFCDFALQPMLEKVYDDFSNQALAKNIDLQINNTRARLHSDPGLLLQILRNLVGNAIKHTRKGQISVQCDAEENGVKISVIDTGEGIAPEHQQEIFNSFFQLKSSVEGFGLGLSIVKGLSESLNHPIKLESKLSVGSTFSILVPTCSEDYQELLQQDHPLLTISKVYKAKILYLEDDQIILEAMDTLLSLEGYQVVAAETYLEAVTDLDNQSLRPPDLIITDNKLAGGEKGLEVVQAIRSKYKLQIPAIMITGFTGSTVERQALEIVQTVFSKPVDVDILFSEISKQLEKPLLAI
jgi:two-component system CheB/CheR fusion protein